jgi:hypothetical protein
MVCLRHLLVLAGFVWAVPAAGPAAFAQETSVPIRLTAPQDGARPALEALTAGPILPARHAEAAELSPLESEPTEPGPAGRAVGAAPSANRGEAKTRPGARLTPGSDILLLIQRQNE